MVDVLLEKQIKTQVSYIFEFSKLLVIFIMK